MVRNRHLASFGALAACLFSTTTEAQTAPPPARLPNAVTCVYEALTPERREMIQALMMAGDEGAGGDPIAAAESNSEVEALIEDGHNACLDLYPWTSGKSGNSIAYALMTIMMDTIHPLMTEGGFAWADVDGYVTANRARLRASAPPTAAMNTALVAHLTGLGWDLSDAEKRGDAESYFAMLMLREYTRQGFASGIFYRESSAWDRGPARR